MNPAGDAGKDKHTQHIGDGRHNADESLAVSLAGAAHHGAAADDGGADRGHEHHRPQRAAGYVEIILALDAAHKPDADDQHEQQIQRDDNQVQNGDYFIMHA